MMKHEARQPTQCYAPRDQRSRLRLAYRPGIACSCTRRLSEDTAMLEAVAPGGAGGLPLGLPALHGLAPSQLQASLGVVHL